MTENIFFTWQLILGTKMMFCNHLIQMRAHPTCDFYSSNCTLQQARVPFEQSRHHLRNQRNTIICAIWQITIKVHQAGEHEIAK